MKISNGMWKENLKSKIRPDFFSEIQEFETDIIRRKDGQIDEKLFAETRLRRGAYGQRYDNGKRFDGNISRDIVYNSKNPVKGPDTLWDAPGMMRIKIPFGDLNPEQCETLADLSEEYSDGIAHVTTRQDIQLHFVHIENTPAIMNRLAAVGITTREACGNSVRNVTACSRAGVCNGEEFDVSPYAKAMMTFFLGHHDVQDFGRKFKIAFSGCKSGDCGLVGIHDLGLIARTRVENNVTEQGFEIYVGGGLGAVPQAARLLFDFIPVAELFPISQAIARVFARLGEKKNRARARLKFLVQKLGVEEFKNLVLEERKVVPHDERWETLLEFDEERLPVASSESSNDTHYSAEEKKYFERNAFPQKQPGFVAIRVMLPLGDMTPWQLRGIADISRNIDSAQIRLTVTQNLLLRWVPTLDFPKVYQQLKALDLVHIGSDGLSDIVACPGTDTCKLGISSSRGLASELLKRFIHGDLKEHPATKDLQIKISGCFNSCSQHHIADIGFYGISRKVGAHTVPHFQVVLGGIRKNNAFVFGMPILAVPSKKIPEVVNKLLSDFIAEKNATESFQEYIQRTGKAQIKLRLQEFTEVKSIQVDRDCYTDWGDVRTHTTSDMGIGECAGEVISRIDFDLSHAEREVFEAQLAYDVQDLQKAGELAFTSMLTAARGLIKLADLDIVENVAVVKKEFQTRFVDSGMFTDPYMGNKFANYFLSAEIGQKFDQEGAHQLIEEAGLFIEAAHSCYVRHGDKLEKTLFAGIK